MQFLSFVWRLKTHLALCALIACTGCKPNSNTKNRASKFSKENLVATEVPDDAIVDKDYCFRIEPMGQKWRLMPESEIVRITPDAVAGATSVEGIFGVVIVEHFPDTDLESYVDLLKSNVSVVPTETTPLESLEYQSKPAMKYGYSAVINGLDLKFENLVFFHQGFGYQILTWGMKQRYTASRSNQFREAFRLTEGTVKVRSKTIPIKDYVGVGRRVTDGRFESAIYKFGCKPPQGWQLLVGASLRELDPTAEIGLMNAEAGTYAIVIPEYIVGLNPESHRSVMTSAIEANLGIGAGGGQRTDPIELKVGPHPTKFQSYQSEQFRYYFGVHMSEDCSYRILAWHLDSSKNAPRKELAKVLESIDFMNDEQASQIEMELASLPDPENKIGPTFSLRSGVYRDFEHGIVWKKPQGLWRVSTGDEAKAMNQDTLFMAESAKSGLFVQLIVEDAEGWDPKTYHDAAMSIIFGDGNAVYGASGKTLELNGTTAIVSEATQLPVESGFRYRLATTIVDNRAFQMIVFGVPANFEKASKQAYQAIEAFSFPGATMVPTEAALPTFRDNRTGFAITVPGSGWSLKQNIQPALEPIGTTIQFTRNNQEILVMALTMLEPGQDISWASDTMTNVISANLSRMIDSKPKTTQKSFAGIQWQMQSWQKRRDTVHLLVGVRHRTVYTLVVTGPDGGGDILLTQITKNFRLLD